MYKVKNFQKKKKLKVTGIVDKKTWLKMGFSEKSWNNLGAYASPIRVNPSSTKKDHIEAMISRAYDYLGSDYVVGASGTPAQGADCSGIVMQAMYAAGVSLDPIGAVRHSKRGYEYESRNMWASKKLKTVPYSSRKRGDLIFYQGRGGAVIHVAIYLGNGKVIESWPNKVVIWPIKNSHRSNIKGVKRVFN
jgi:cell wall-associated NlpC family hydrolase